MKAVTRLALVAAVASLAACSGGTAEPAATPSPSSPLTQLIPESTAASTPADDSTALTPNAPTEHLDAIRADLTNRGVDNSELTVTHARQVTWQDGSLGCGEPGATYTQAQVEGWQIVVNAAGQSYDYRFGGNTTPMLCERPTVISESPTSNN